MYKMPPESQAFGAVFSTRKDIKFIEHQFPFKLQVILDMKTQVIFTPPVHYAKPNLTMHLAITSDNGGISVSPFEVQGPFNENEQHVVGGVVIGVGGEEKLIIVSSEYPIYNTRDVLQGYGPYIYLLKVRADDDTVLLMSRSGYNNGKPYTFQNSYGGRKGILIDEKNENQLTITHINGETLIERKTIK